MRLDLLGNALLDGCNDLLVRACAHLQAPHTHLLLLADALADLDGALAARRVQLVHLLEREHCRLRVAEVNERDKEEVGDHEDEVGLPLQAVDDDGRDHDDDKVLGERIALV